MEDQEVVLRLEALKAVLEIMELEVVLMMVALDTAKFEEAALLVEDLELVSWTLEMESYLRTS